MRKHFKTWKQITDQKNLHAIAKIIVGVNSFIALPKSPSTGLGCRD